MPSFSEIVCVGLAELAPEGDDRECPWGYFVFRILGPVESERRILKLAMNRVEGDVELKVQLDGRTITDAWCVGTMYRGFEQILRGRDPLDALVITPRICGICSTSQLYAAAVALETAFGCTVAPNGTRVRNLCLMAEEVQSDARQTFLMFAVDFCNEAYRAEAEFDAVVEMFAPFRGRIYKEVVRNTKKILDVVVNFGASWPHSTYMMPGGITSPIGRQKIVECLTAINSYTAWYEQSVLGCPSDRWLAVRSAGDFGRWLEESDAHRQSALGLFARFGRAIGLQRLGRATPNLLGFGVGYDPVRWQPRAGERNCLKPGGFYNGESGAVEPLDHHKVTEHVRHSWFAEADARHPWEGETVPHYREDGPAYSFCKAPRYGGHVVQVGPLSDLVVGGDPLISDFFRQEGPSTWLRQFARLHRPVVTLTAMREHVKELLLHISEPALEKNELPPNGDGVGLVNAARGALGHWVRIRDGKIAEYQIITPTAWNGSPRDDEGRRGHWEESLIGLTIRDLDNPVEVGHVIRSHDACLVCTVHFLDSGHRVTYPV
jgi:hydrogenase large subunit